MEEGISYRRGTETGAGDVEEDLRAGSGYPQTDRILETDR